MSDKVDELLSESARLWAEASDICPNRDLESDSADPGNAPHCGHKDNSGCMGWCEPGACPLISY